MYGFSAKKRTFFLFDDGNWIECKGKTNAKKTKNKKIIVQFTRENEPKLGTFFFGPLRQAGSSAEHTTVRVNVATSKVQEGEKGDPPQASVPHRLAFYYENDNRAYLPTYLYVIGGFENDHTPHAVL